MGENKEEKMSFHLRIWRQKKTQDQGKFIDYNIKNVSNHASFLEMLDQLNEELIACGEEPVAFEHDCREGICGTCGVNINGNPHGSLPGTTTCQLHMRHFTNGETITIEPFRAKPFTLIKDLVVSRSSFDRIISKGGYVSVSTGNAPSANAILVDKETSDTSFDAATCIGCGACVAACKNASASLFVSAKLSHLNLLPQGKTETKQRTQKMVAQMEKEGFGACSNTGSCSAACPKQIDLSNIARMNRTLLKSHIS